MKRASLPAVGGLNVEHAFRRRLTGGIRRVLWGLCDGSSASLIQVGATQDPRNVGVSLLNPWGRSEVSLARARVKHYYRQRLQEAELWRKLLKGRVGFERPEKLWMQRAPHVGSRAGNTDLPGPHIARMAILLTDPFCCCSASVP